MFAFRVYSNNTFKSSFKSAEVKIVENILVASEYEKGIEEDIETEENMKRIEEKVKKL